MDPDREHCRISESSCFEAAPGIIFLALAPAPENIFFFCRSVNEMSKLVTRDYIHVDTILFLL